MMTQTRQVAERGKTPATLWWSMVAGFLAFGADLGFSYPLQQHSCSTGKYFLLHVISVVCAVIALSGVVTGWRGYQSLPEEVSEDGSSPHDRAHFQALLGMAFCLFFLLAIVANAVPRWILDPCM